MKAFSRSSLVVVVFGAVVMVSSMAQARGGGGGGMSGVLVSANAFMYNQSVDNNGATGDSNLTIYDIKGGYLSGDGLYLGGIYSNRSSSGSSVISQSGSAAGVSVGYMGDAGFYLMGHYYLSATNGDYSDGSGYQADFGYMANVTSAFYVGVELTYRNLEYKKVNGASTSLKVKELFPMLTAAFIF